MLAAHFPAYYGLGSGHGNLLAFGVFDLDAGGTNRLLDGGRYTDGAAQPMAPHQIAEYVKYAWYTPTSGNRHPAEGVTEPDAEKAEAYSWVKAPRYADKPHELGPLARMWINNRYTHGISAMDRIVARAQEAKLIADAMDAWLDELVPDAPVYIESTVPQQATAAGLTEAPRGALGHWMDIDGGVINRYQVITPTAWNASPKDDLEQKGPLEAALIGLPVADVDQPVEVVRVVHSFDPCLACGVHMLRPGQRATDAQVLIPPGIL
jgi:hydrogenase large subunit